MCDRERAVGVTLAAPVGLQPRTRIIVSTESHGTQHPMHMIFIALAMMFKRSVHVITRSAEGGREGAYSSAAGSYGSYALAAMATTHLSIADEGVEGHVDISHAHIVRSLIRSIVQTPASSVESEKHLVDCRL